MLFQLLTSPPVFPLLLFFWVGTDPDFQRIGTPRFGIAITNLPRHASNFFENDVKCGLVLRTATVCGLPTSCFRCRSSTSNLQSGSTVKEHGWDKAWVKIKDCVTSDITVTNPKSKFCLPAICSFFHSVAEPDLASSARPPFRRPADVLPWARRPHQLFEDRSLERCWQNFITGCYQTPAVDSLAIKRQESSTSQFSDFDDSKDDFRMLYPFWMMRVDLMISFI